MSVHDKTLKAKADTTLIGCTRRIVSTYRLATVQQVKAGAKWYAEAGRAVREVAKVGDISKDRAAIVIAHLSPRTTWRRNIIGALQLVQSGRADGCMGRNVTNAQSALAATDPWSTFSMEARKTRRFAMNLLGRTDVVTVDVWAARVALGRGWGPSWRTGEDGDLDLLMDRAGVYEAIESAYLRAGRSLDTLATTVQAATWIVARNGRVG
jgi:hypothetical protein